MRSTAPRLGAAPLFGCGFLYSSEPLWRSAAGAPTREAPPSGPAVGRYGGRRGRAQGRGEGGGGGARAAGGGAPAGWRRAQPHHLRLLRRPAGPEPSHSSLWPTPSVCVPASPRPGSRMMTLKASEGEGGGSMRTALSDLYLEHLLQKRSRPEVSGPRGSPGRGVRGQDSASGVLPAAGPPPSTALAPEGLSSGVLSLG